MLFACVTSHFNNNHQKKKYLRCQSVNTAMNLQVGKFLNSSMSSLSRSAQFNGVGVSQVLEKPMKKDVLVLLVPTRT
jgi:hypothetical protein